VHAPSRALIGKRHLPYISIGYADDSVDVRRPPDWRLMHIRCILPHVDIEFDPAKARSNLQKHKVSFAHAEQALRDPLALTVEDPDAEREQRFVTLGMDALGRLLVVVHTPRGSRTRLISARKASKGESEQYGA
jgi:uncharacterized DUF497 family protein